jgi:tetratricopeptide (TPR) repeat protein
MARKRLLTVEEAILLHLLDHVKHTPDSDVPMDMTQAGISRSLGVRRSHVSTSLDFAKNRGTLEEHLSRVRGEKRKRKCYFLTPMGLASSREIRSRVLGTEIGAAKPDGSLFHGTFESLLKETKGKSNLARLALLCAEGHLAIPSEPERAEPSARTRAPVVGKLLGREKELLKLKSLFDGEAGLLFLTGMPGIGKTWLAATAASKYGGASTFWYTINEWSSPRNLSSHLANFLAENGNARLRRYMDTHEVPDPADIHDILLETEFRFVMMLDGCHDANPAMMPFLDMLASASTNSYHVGVALVGRHIPDPVGKRPLTDRFITIELDSLDDVSSMALLEMKGIPESRARSIARKSRGHPLYLSLAGNDDGSSEASDVERMLATEVSDMLSPRENEFLSLLSVFRAPVGSDAMVETTEDMKILESLKKRCIISEQDGWSMHALLRDFYLAKQAPADRFARHERAAEYYNRHPGDFGNQIEEIHHLLMAGDVESAIVVLISKGQEMLARGYVDELLGLCAMVPGDWQNPDDALGLSYLKASAEDLLGNWDDAAESYGASLKIARELDDRDREAAILRRLGAIQYRQGSMTEARNIFEMAMKLTQSPALVAELHGSLGVVLWKLGDTASARKSHESDLSISTMENDRIGMARALNNLGILDWEAGNNTAAMEKYTKAMRFVQKKSDLRMVAILYSNMGDVQRTMGYAEDARRYYERCLELAEDLKFNWQVAEAYRGLAEIVPEKRRDYLSRALTIFERLGADSDAKTVREMMA